MPGKLVYSRFIQQLGRLVIGGGRRKKYNLAPCEGSGDGRHSWHRETTPGMSGASHCVRCGKFKFEVAKERRENKKLLNQYLKEQGEPPYQPPRRRSRKRGKSSAGESFPLGKILWIMFIIWILLFIFGGGR